MKKKKKKEERKNTSHAGHFEPFFCLLLKFFFLFLISFFLTAFVRIHPATRHIDSLGPSLVQFGALHLGNVRGKRRTVGTIHVFQFRVVLPNINGESSRDGRTKGGGFVHRGSIYGHLTEIGLVLSIVISFGDHNP